jgi:hypothetical protein
MLQIVLTDEQAKVVASSRQPVQVCDARGNILGHIEPMWTEADIAEAERRLKSDERRYTTSEVLEFLGSLEKE